MPRQRRNTLTHNTATLEILGIGTFFFKPSTSGIFAFGVAIVRVHDACAEYPVFGIDVYTVQAGITDWVLDDQRLFFFLLFLSSGGWGKIKL